MKRFGVLLAASGALLLGSAAPASAAPPRPGGSGWSATATAFRGQNGARFTYTCPAGGAAGAVWGTNVYTDDSSVCTAAVHAGRLTLAAGGTVTIVIRPALSSYQGSARNGISTSSYGPWHGSFVLVGGAASPAPSLTGGSGWRATATALRGRNGSRFVYACPAGGSAGQVWGTDTYTDDSSVCTAAVHAGLVSLAGGGKVTIEVRPGLSAYQGSARNGISTAGYGPWKGSFVFVGTPSTVSTAITGGTGWSATATAFRGQNGSRFTYSCPAGGTAGRVWGTDVYTDDSSVCAAAVHAGRITLVGGGVVTIEIRPDAGTYTGTARNGISTANYGAWHGSFVFV